MADLKTQLEIGVDASGVDTGINKAKQSISSLGAAAEAAGTQGSAGLDKVGAAGEKASKKLDSATRSLRDTAQRNIAAIEAGVQATDRMSVRYIGSLAKQRGASIDVLRPYLTQLHEAIGRQNALNAAVAKQKALQEAIVRQQAEAARPISVPAFTTSRGATDFVKPLPTSVVLGRPTSVPNFGTALGATAFGEVANAAAKAGPAVDAFNKKFDYTALTAKQTVAALRQVPAQLTDIFVSLQGGQAPLTVLLQQGGQLKDVFGGIGPAARALGGYVVGLINPFTLAAAAVAGLGAAYYVSTKRQDEFAKSLILSGNAVGVTVSGLQGMAESISGNIGSLGEASEALTKFAADGNVAAANLEKFTQASIRLEKFGGQAVAKTVEQFAALAKDPLQASVKLNESTRYLTTAIYQQIKALEEQGRMAEAASLAQIAYFNAIESRGGALEVRLGNIERLWERIKKAASGALDTAVGSFDPPSLGKLEAQLKVLEERKKNAAPGGLRAEMTDGEIAATKTLIENARELNRLGQRAASTQAESARQVKDRIDAEAVLKRNLVDKTDLLNKELKIIENLRKSKTITDDEATKAIAGARERFKPAAGPKGPRDPQRSLDRSDLAFDLSQIKSEADELVRVYADAERIIEALRSSGLVKDKDYYESRRQFLELETQAKDAALQKEIARLQQEQGLIDARKAKDPTDTAQKARDSIDNTRKIAEAESQLAILRARNSSRAVILDIEETRVAKEKTDALLSARQAAEAYFESQNRQQNRNLEAFGQGPREQVFTQGVNQIDDNFAQQERELQNLKVLGKLTQEEYDARLAIIREFQTKSIQSFTEYYARLIEMQGSAAVGAQQAAKTYIDEAANVAASTNDLVSNSLRGLEDGLTDFLTTGKFKYKDFATSIVADINRIIIKQQIANALAGLMGASGGGSDAIGKFFGALLGSTTGSSVAMSSGQFGIGVAGFAMGGVVERGRLVEVNEGDGPGELFNVGNRQYLLASQSGQVVPQKQSSSPQHQAMTVINNFTLSGRVDRATEMQVAKAAGLGVQRALARA